MAKSSKWYWWRVIGRVIKLQILGEDLYLGQLNNNVNDWIPNPSHNLVLVDSQGDIIGRTILSAAAWSCAKRRRKSQYLVHHDINSSQNLQILLGIPRIVWSSIVLLTPLLKWFIFAMWSIKMFSVTELSLLYLRFRLEVKGEGGDCAFLNTDSAVSSRCHRIRNWICSHPDNYAKWQDLEDCVQPLHDCQSAPPNFHLCPNFYY